MTKPNLKERATRLRHYQGERLVAQDLNDEYDNLTWLRELHIVALHNTWGIALGYEVQSTSQGYILVGPGLAYDAQGNEIVLSESQAIVGPQAFAPGTNVDGPYELVIDYDATLGARTAGVEAVPCGSAAGNPKQDRPAFNWRKKGETQLGIDVPLLGIAVIGGQIDPLSLDLSVRRYAQPLIRPHIASGVTPREQGWELWMQNETPFGIRTWIDTTDAGFLGTPYYLAVLNFQSELPSGSLASLASYPGFFFSSVSTPFPTGFDFQVVFAERRLLELRSAGAAASGFQLPSYQVSWIGIEPVGGCPPPAFFDILSRFLNVFRSPSLF